MLDHLDVLLDLFGLEAERLREIGNPVVLQQAQMIAHQRLDRRAGEAEVTNLQQQALLQVARADADRIERLDVLERLLDERRVPVAERRDLVDRRDQVAVLVDVADDRRADLAQRLVGRLQVRAATSDDRRASSCVESVFSIGGSSLTSCGCRGR